MATQRKSRKKARAVLHGAPAYLLDALHQIYLAGLGAVSRARSGAPQLLEELIAEGARVHADTRGAAEKALQQVLGDAHAKVTARVGQVRGQATDALESLEKIFQTRVHRALTQLGVPGAEEVAALSKRVDALNTNIEKLARRARKAAGPRSGAKGRAEPPPAAAP